MHLRIACMKEQMLYFRGQAARQEQEVAPQILQKER
jgi:hypothetical protein